MTQRASATTRTAHACAHLCKLYLLRPVSSTHSASFYLILLCVFGIYLAYMGYRTHTHTHVKLYVFCNRNGKNEFYLERDDERSGCAVMDDDQIGEELRRRSWLHKISIYAIFKRWLTTHTCGPNHCRHQLKGMR